MNNGMYYQPVNTINFKELAKETALVFGILTGIKLYGKTKFKQGVIHEKRRAKHMDDKEPTIIDVMFEEIEP